MAGSCFIVGAPIGEEDDFTQRGIRTLQSANIIVAPDEKETARLLKRFSIAKPLLGIGEELTDEVSAEVLERLHKGERVAIMSASALFLTDPVRILANRIRREGLEPRVIPGVDLVMMALLMSGFRTDSYFVAGFIPTRKEPREEFVRSLAERPETAVVFASAPRLTSTLAGLAMKMPDRAAAIILKPTVPGEIALRGTVRELRERLASKMLSGTATIVLAPQGENAEESEENTAFEGIAEEAEKDQYPDRAIIDDILSIGSTTPEQIESMRKEFQQMRDTMDSELIEETKEPETVNEDAPIVAQEENSEPQSAEVEKLTAPQEEAGEQGEEERPQEEARAENDGEDPLQ